LIRQEVPIEWAAVVCRFHFCTIHRRTAAAIVCDCYGARNPTEQFEIFVRIELRSGVRWPLQFRVVSNTILCDGCDYFAL